jgi:cytochrome oxidase Cu insertion factor (SCO1/SenC/PrrC family)
MALRPVQCSELWILVLFFGICTAFAGCAAFGHKEYAGRAYPAPEVGERAPDFWMKNQDQLRVSLSDFAGKKNVILVFFPLAFTPV